MKIIVKTPSHVFEGKRHGVQFRKGKAEFTCIDTAKKVCEEYGYELIVEGEEKPKARTRKKVAK